MPRLRAAEWCRATYMTLWRLNERHWTGSKPVAVNDNGAR
jgi:hypothetical protein